MVTYLFIHVRTTCTQPQDIANLAHGLARLRGLCDANQHDDEEVAAAAAGSYAASPSFLRGLQVRAHPTIMNACMPVSP